MLESIVVDQAVLDLCPGFAVLLMTAEGLTNDLSDDASRGWLSDATVPDDLSHVTAWQEAYRAFGTNPKRARPSVDALIRRHDALPEINRVVDAYNAISVSHVLPIGGEDLDAYQGPARLTISDGSEKFATVKNGEPIDEHPDAGEVIWRDDAGVTCRRWNWRQCTRTQITERTKNALFILERLEPYPLAALETAGTDLAALLNRISPGVRISTRLIAP
jgi:DNA/RNA-binding domain of Phe-tRNA-synthetase-like protein